MFDALKNWMRRRSLRHAASAEPTALMPLGKVRSATVFIDVEDTSFDVCKNEIMAFFRNKGIKGEIFFFDFRRLNEGERLITSITNTVLKKDINWFGKPSKEKVSLMLDGNPDMFISLLANDGFPIHYMAAASRARFKVGRVPLPGKVFDLVVQDPENGPLSEAGIFREMVKILERIQ